MMLVGFRAWTWAYRNRHMIVDPLASDLNWHDGSDPRVGVGLWLALVASAAATIIGAALLCTEAVHLMRAGKVSPPPVRQ